MIMPFYSSKARLLLHEIKFPHLGKHQRPEKVQRTAARVIKTLQHSETTREEILTFQDPHKVEILGQRRSSFLKCQHMLILKHNMLLGTLTAVPGITAKLLKFQGSNTLRAALLLRGSQSPRATITAVLCSWPAQQPQPWLPWMDVICSAAEA